MAISADLIRQALDNLKTADRPYLKPGSARDFLPKTLGRQPMDTTVSDMIFESIGNRGEAATRLLQTRVQNQKEYDLMMKRKAQLERQRELLERIRGNRPDLIERRQRDPRTININLGNYGGNRNWARRWGRDNTPEVSDLRRLRPNAPIIGVDFRGREFQVNRQVAPIFLAFLEELWKMGYKPHSIGGHADRNIAGTSTPSLHSYGFAIDVDPTRNPVTRNGRMITDLPPGVGALAAKYGLAWGGNWNSYKDPMHFSVPWGGRQ